MAHVGDLPLVLLCSSVWNESHLLHALLFLTSFLHVAKASLYILSAYFNVKYPVCFSFKAPLGNFTQWWLQKPESMISLNFEGCITYKSRKAAHLLDL